jgi:hypothetical protein
MIPRAYLLTYVTTEYPPSQQGTEFGRNGTFVFYGEIGDTTTGIECAIGQDASSGTRFNAACAGSTSICIEGWINFQRYSKKDFPEKEEGSDLRVDQAGILPYPSQTCSLCEFSLKERTRVGIYSMGNRLSG